MIESARSAHYDVLADPQPSVTLRAPGRLHLGFLDPAGTLGRRFGSLGLVIDGFPTEIDLSASDVDRITASGAAEGAAAERAAGYLATMRRRSGRSEPLHLTLARVPPAHAGFGTGTQLALAVGRAFAQWHRLDLGTPLLAQWLGRGLRSGVGIGGFDHGGLLLDGGPGADGTPAPVLSRIAMPDAWRVVVVQDDALRGLSGDDERQAIAALAPMPQALAAELCHQVLMRVLPGAASAEFAPFATGVSRIQQLLGEYFAPVQSGSAFTSAAVRRLVEWMASAARESGADNAPAAHAAAAAGQSSWGPTGFVILPSQAQAERVLEAARAAKVVGPSLTVNIVSARNAGAALVDRRPHAAVR
ncbi:MAG: beta-ribofuranosylaminobenzene 5'-phosphate synthase family protein [Burkholderiaceae bacterium]